MKVAVAKRNFLAQNKGVRFDGHRGGEKIGRER